MCDSLNAKLLGLWIIHIVLVFSRMVTRLQDIAGAVSCTLDTVAHRPLQWFNANEIKGSKFQHKSGLHTLDITRPQDQNLPRLLIPDSYKGGD